MMESQIRILKMGINTKNPGGTVRRIPHGEDYFIFLQSCSPMQLSTAKGMQTMDANHCILYCPNTPRYLSSVDEDTPFVNNWMFFQWSDFHKLCVSYDIPFNEVIFLRDPHKLSKCFEEISRETILSPAHHQRSIQLLVEEMLIYLAREIILGQADLTTQEHYYALSLQRLREDIYNNPMLDWRLETMAQQVSISVSYLSSLYNKLFHTSPKRDVLMARINSAQFSLTYSDTSIGEIARLSGFQNEFYFSRYFKHVTGVSPSEYRKHNRHLTK